MTREFFAVEFSHRGDALSFHYCVHLWRICSTAIFFPMSISNAGSKSPIARLLLCDDGQRRSGNRNLACDLHDILQDGVPCEVAQLARHDND